MHLGIIVETNDPERVWNAFRLANTALDADHIVEVFLLGDGVEAPDLEHEKFNPHGVMLKYTQNGGELSYCGACLDSRGLDPDELRPRATMEDCLRIVEEAEKVLTVGLRNLGHSERQTASSAACSVCRVFPCTVSAVDATTQW